MKTMNNTSKTAIGADIGGSHITTAVVDLESGNILPGTRVRAAVNAHAPADEILGIWETAIQKVMRQMPEPATQIGFDGVGTPGKSCRQISQAIRGGVAASLRRPTRQAKQAIHGGEGSRR